MGYIEFHGLSKRYPKKEQWALKEFQLSMERGEFLAIVGPSGSGKSTLLNVLTGFEDATAGSFILEGEDVTNRPPKNRNISLVFQEYALFPHMTVKENISFGMKIRKEGKQYIEEKVKWAAEKLELKELLQEKPKHLSGGQRQRVALARAIVREPKLFLLDEPLSNLDAKLREQTGALIRQVHDQLEATTIFVTHAQDEAMSLADRIVVVKDGAIQQIGTPKEIYERPDNLFVARFIGRPEINCLAGELLADGSLRVGQQIIGQGFDYVPAQKVTAAIRSEDLAIVAAEKDSLKGSVQSIRYLGSDLLVSILWGEVPLIIRTAPDAEVTVGQEIYFLINQSKILIFSNEDNQKLNVL
ncbi:ABC transporter ATP-binding protein [Enterococcus sp. LJL51]|uniref:ABC transporter ATP-binding protein n=1 Tax=Enterococcus sp. LJL51 TaxID=3416656 RepID=UPI003CFA56E9